MTKRSEILVFHMDIYIAYLVCEIKTLANGIYNSLSMLRIGDYQDNEYLEDAFLSAEYLLHLLDSQFIAAQKKDIGKRAPHKFQERVTVRTFGDFDIFIDGELIEFTNKKAKELFAICVDSCGGEVTMKKAVSLLWENRNYDEKVKRLYRKAVLYLNMLFEQYKVEDVFRSARGHCHVNRHKIYCDYYEVMEGINISETSFHGKYMSNYSWAEETCGILCRMAAKQLRE